MFGGSKVEVRRERTSGLSVIGADMTIRGDITTEGDLHVDGLVEGDISCGSLIQGGSGRIVGTLRAREARIAGTIEGTIHAERLTIEGGARITGDSHYHMLTIATGAQVDGRMTPEGSAAEAPLRLVDATG